MFSDYTDCYWNNLQVLRDWCFLWIKGPKSNSCTDIKEKRIIFSSVKTVIAGAVVTALTVILIPARCSWTQFW